MKKNNCTYYIRCLTFGDVPTASVIPETSDNLVTVGTNVPSYAVPAPSETVIAKLKQFLLQEMHKRSNNSGHITQQRYFAASSRIVFYTVFYRYCGMLLLYNIHIYLENVSKCHKSNNVFLVVDLQRHCWYQKCLDHDCSNYVPLEYAVPKDVVSEK